MPATIKHHESRHDWCHLCGERSDATADLWWAENAEHDRGPVNPMEAAYRGRYLRACAECAERIAIAADPKAPMRNCGLHPDATTEPCRSLVAGRPLCDLCAARAAVAMAHEDVERLRLAHRESEHRLAVHDCGEESARLYVEAGEATALAMKLANALDGSHRMGGECIGEPCEICDLLSEARRWAR